MMLVDVGERFELALHGVGRKAWHRGYSWFQGIRILAERPPAANFVLNRFMPKCAVLACAVPYHCGWRYKAGTGACRAPQLLGGDTMRKIIPGRRAGHRRLLRQRAERRFAGRQVETLDDRPARP